MNDGQFDDLKQFIETTVGQTEMRLTRRLDGLEGRLDGVEGRLEGMERRLESLEHKVDDGFAAIGNAVEQIHHRIDQHEADATLHVSHAQPLAA